MLLQAKADEIAKLMNENERLKSIIEDLKVGMNLAAFLLFVFLMKLTYFHQKMSTISCYSWFMII